MFLQGFTETLLHIHSESGWTWPLTRASRLIIRKGGIHCIFVYLFIYPSIFLGPHPWHMEVPRLGVQSELLLPAYARTNHSNVGSELCLQPTPQLMAMPDP